MTTSFKQCIEYRLVDVNTVNEHLRLGFEPFGSAFYHPIQDSCFQALVKYTNPAQKLLPYLTKREEECLSYLLRGFSVKQMAYDLCCSRSNVDKILARVKTKFNVKNLRLLIYQAIEKGFKPT